MSIKFNFENRLAIVTGGARGIGRRIADRLAASGADTHVFDVGISDEERRDAWFQFHAVDVTDPASVGAAVASLGRPVDLLVNNAGITRDRSIGKMSDAEWTSVIDVNLTGAFNLLRVVGPIMTAAGYGRIVNVTSINGMRGKFGQANYAASKGGLIALTKTAAREFGRKGVTVNAVAPGMVMTDMAGKLPAEILDQARKDTVSGILCTPDDIADGVLFLLSDGAKTITGEVLRIDSGQYI